MRRTICLAISLALGLMSVVAAPVAQACDPGCTYTPGYWKTHPEAWPSTFQPDDPAGNGQTVMEALWTPPRGSAWHQLAHQYIAALLNSEAGASSPQAVKEAIGQGFFLLALGPELVNGNKEPRQSARSYAETLDDYNNGIIGPGHCDG
jgi:hypothetical protein